MSLFVKICGITRPEDADLAVGLGAGALGFVFWPASPRYIDAAAARAITANVPRSVAKVGVFVDEPAAAIARSVVEAGLDAAQLHGGETPEFCRVLRAHLANGPGGLSPTVIKAIALRGEDAVGVDFDPDVLLLLDAHDPVQRGGTGRTVNWDSARTIAATRRTILAGGLNAANVKLASHSVRPYGIDVSSGVESSPGVTDSDRLRSFFEALHD